MQLLSYSSVEKDHSEAEELENSKEHKMVENEVAAEQLLEDEEEMKVENPQLEDRLG